MLLASPLLLLLLPSLMLMVSMLLLLSYQHAVAGFITFASIPAIDGVLTVLAVLLLLSFLL